MRRIITKQEHMEIILSTNLRHHQKVYPVIFARFLKFEGFFLGDFANLVKIVVWFFVVKVPKVLTVPKYDFGDFFVVFLL